MGRRSDVRYDFALQGPKHFAEANQYGWTVDGWLATGCGYSIHSKGLGVTSDAEQVTCESCKRAMTQYVVAKLAQLE